MPALVLGSRGSRLALWQTNMVRDAVVAAHPDVGVSIEVIHTRGDKILDVPLAKVGGKGLFVKEIEDALLDGRCDAAVHSLKDVPAELPGGLILGAACERELPWDAFVSERHGAVTDLPEGARVGTSSLRRVCQLLAMRPDLEVVPLRGNVETRLRKLSEGLDAVVLAAAGLRRLGLGDRITALLTPPEFVPAVGQGIVVVECREGDAATRGLLASLDHGPTRVAMAAERAFLAAVGGSCQVPLGAIATVDGDRVDVTGMIGRPDGGTILKDREAAASASAAEAGRRIAERLLGAGGREILEQLTTAGGQ
ncbi:MAG: hydroxymethylbilane synthase [Deltaproteobacteria bacterium]|nr:hydroxymethylbilane synthase [Deltaproteobacteria bacterium]